MKRLFTSLAVGLLATATVIDAETYTVDPVHSVVDFSIRHLVGRTKGRFGEFGGTIVYDPAKPAQATLSGTIKAASINTDNDKRDEHLRSQDFFWVQEHPEITFVSTEVEPKGDNLLHVTGDLTLRGVTKEVTLPVEIIGTGVNPMNNKKQIGLATELTVKRSTFGVDHWSDTAGVLGDEVQVEILIEANAVD